MDQAYFKLLFYTYKILVMPLPIYIENVKSDTKGEVA